METIALFGGSFDPPHIGHIAVVEALKKIDNIDKIIIMPTFLNPFKTLWHAPAELRLQWLREIFRDDKKVVVSDYEVLQERRVPSIESVEYLLKQYKKIYLVIGADNLASLTQWHRFSELEKKVSFIVAPRDNIKIPQKYLSLEVDEEISSSALRENINIKKLSKRCAQEIAHFYKDKHAKQNR
jgi:nicotinate-nucleotide adenylyltransferase